MSHPLRVAHVVLSLDRDGGLEKVLVDALGRFDPRRVRSCVVCTVEPGELACRVESAGVPVRVVAKRRAADLSVPWRLARLFRAEGIELVHTYSGVYRDGCLGGLLAGVPIQVHTDQGRLYPDTWRTRWTHRTLSRARDRVVAVSDDLRQYLIARVGVPPDRLAVIPNAVEPGMYEGAAGPQRSGEALGLPAGALAVGIVARLVPVKDHRTVLRAAAEVFQDVPEAHLLVVGDGPLRGELEALARDLGIAERTRFLGLRTDVPALLPCLDLIVLSSLHEGTSLTLLEAMASGLPVVATAVGGTPEVVLHERTGLLVPPRRPDLLAQAITRLLRSPRRREEMGQAGQARVVARFGIQAMVEAYQRLYEELARAKGVHA